MWINNIFVRYLWKVYFKTKKKKHTKYAKVNTQKY